MRDGSKTDLKSAASVDDDNKDYKNLEERSPSDKEAARSTDNSPRSSPIDPHGSETDITSVSRTTPTTTLSSNCGLPEGQNLSDTSPATQKEVALQA